jgi:prepilin peptidase CpaA
LGGLVVAAVTDVRSRIIHNPTVLWVMGAGVASRVAVDGWQSWISLIAALAVFLPLGLLAGRGLVGGGDAKMIGAATLLVEPGAILGLLVSIALAGGVLAVVYLVRAALVARHDRDKSVAVAPGGGPGALVEAAADSKALVPYGLAILAGAALIVCNEVFGCSSATSC